VPQRRCVGCGRIAPKPELLRIALGAAESSKRRLATIDHAGTMPGRGAYVCRAQGAACAYSPNRSCLERASRRGAIGRALRAAVTLAPELVESPGGVGAAGHGTDGGSLSMLSRR
jgi:predicted RNA-binding protein YlxR (DUF448 family)